ncbi:hypothetical protein NMY22_g16802 [Coprinellus aureogranulatus]|nr:hypothetical protein NMY22_g16802 [Coprinellus aureogranulatus]
MRAADDGCLLAAGQETQEYREERGLEVVVVAVKEVCNLYQVFTKTPTECEHLTCHEPSRTDEDPNLYRHSKGGPRSLRPTLATYGRYDEY